VTDRQTDRRQAALAIGQTVKLNDRPKNCITCDYLQDSKHTKQVTVVTVQRCSSLKQQLGVPLVHRLKFLGFELAYRQLSLLLDVHFALKTNFERSVFHRSELYNLSVCDCKS